MKIKEKLQSSKGASLIIALVFMLFCAMVGSAVLAAATANGGRVAALKSDQQDYLNQRSAATLLQDELTISEPLLVITKTTTTTVKLTSLPSLKDSPPPFWTLNVSFSGLPLRFILSDIPSYRIGC